MNAAGMDETYMVLKLVMRVSAFITMGMTMVTVMAMAAGVLCALLVPAVLRVVATMCALLAVSAGPDRTRKLRRKRRFIYS